MSFIYACTFIQKAIEAKKVLGSYDTSYFLKEQVDVLKGRNEELRSTLREVRVESSKTALERDKAFERVSKMCFQEKPSVCQIA